MHNIVNHYTYVLIVVVKHKVSNFQQIICVYQNVQQKSNITHHLNNVFQHVEQLKNHLLSKITYNVKNHVVLQFHIDIFMNQIVCNVMKIIVLKITLEQQINLTIIILIDVNLIVNYLMVQFHINTKDKEICVYKNVNKVNIIIVQCIAQIHVQHQNHMLKKEQDNANNYVKLVITEKMV